VRLACSAGRWVFYLEDGGRLEAAASEAGDCGGLSHVGGRVGGGEDVRLAPVDDAEADRLLALVAHAHRQVGGQAGGRRGRLQWRRFLQPLSANSH